ncbi:MAG TPA: MBOAT family protein [Leptolyngbyaceae cyanobacterium]
MLFNSVEFIFLFLPITLIGYFWLGSPRYANQPKLKIIWLAITSLFFYSWWNPWNLPIILVSLAFNYFWGEILAGHKGSQNSRKVLLGAGVIANLLLLGYFKYIDFIFGNINFVFGTQIQPLNIVLPLGISFFTFQQIAYLVDAYAGATKEYDFAKYSLFVTFFPQLIAGPIVHHKDIIPQLSERSAKPFSQQAMAIGITVFVAGLFKKVVLADSIATFANLAFNAAGQGVPLTFSEAWVGALAYTVQLYFDFSGYSDMAIGAAYMFGVSLPLNFYSPYKAISIVDFWRRWHITLSNFLRDYLYIPLGGSRRGNVRRYGNLLVTMLLGGLWHGAGWTFVIWGGIHGCYLMINHGYRGLRKSLGHDLKKDPAILKGIGWAVTFVAVVVAWVFFRANTPATAFSMLASMFGARGIELPNFLESQLGFLRSFGIGFAGFTVNVGISQKYSVFGTALLLMIVWFSPNVYQIMGRYNPSLDELPKEETSVWSQKLEHLLQWRPNWVWSAVAGVMMSLSLLCFTRVSEFLYFQF